MAFDFLQNAGPVGAISSAAATAALQRTFLIQTQTASGIPIPLAVLDVVTEENPEFEADVTEHPVEQGTEVTDHIQLKNPTLRLKGKISNTPLDLSVSIGNVVSGGIAAISSSQARSNLLNTGLQQGASILGAKLLGKASASGSQFQAGAADAISRTILLNAYQNKTPFDVVTKRQRYTNMVIQRLAFPRNQQTGYALEFEIDLKQVRIVSAVQVQFTQLDEKSISTASSSTSLGSQSTQAASSQVQSQTQGSWLRQITNGKFPNFFGGG